MTRISMMMTSTTRSPRRPIARPAIAALAALVVLAVSGCGSPSKQDVVNNAETRWKQMRSTLMLQMAEQQFATGDLDQAERSLRDAMAVDATNSQLYVLAGRIALERGQLERGYHLLTQAIELAPKRPEGYYYQAIVLQRWQRYDAALQQYDQAHKLQADNVAYLLAMGEMLVTIGRMDEAQALFEGKLIYFDQNAAIRLALAQIHMMRGESDRAVRYLREASVLQPEQLSIREDLAFAQLASGQAADAVETLLDLTRRPEYVDRTDMQRMLAQAYLEAGRPEEARAIHLRMGRQNPSDVDAWIGLAKAAWVMEDVSSTLYASDRIIRLAPHRHEGYMLAGMSLQQKQQWSEAAAMYDRAVQVKPGDAELVLLRGVTRQQAGQRELAMADYRMALKLSPDNPRAERLLAQVDVQGFAAVGELIEP
jgi:tetratricopeptide (TPR) repeat protein